MPRPLDPDIYDALELSAMEFGGIGRLIAYESDSEWDSVVVKPVCLWGHLDYIGAYNDLSTNSLSLEKALNGPIVSENDKGVLNINLKKGRDPNARVSFEEWCEYFGIVRGE